MLTISCDHQPVDWRKLKPHDPLPHGNYGSYEYCPDDMYQAVAPRWSSEERESTIGRGPELGVCWVCWGVLSGGREGGREIEARGHLPCHQEPLIMSVIASVLGSSAKTAMGWKYSSEESKRKSEKNGRKHRAGREENSREEESM
eukprot:25800-Hanusia_phi.AAC.1